MLMAFKFTGMADPVAFIFHMDTYTGRPDKAEQVLALCNQHDVRMSNIFNGEIGDEYRSWVVESISTLAMYEGGLTTLNTPYKYTPADGFEFGETVYVESGNDADISGRYAYTFEELKGLL